jgi:hypothetical protein
VKSLLSVYVRPKLLERIREKASALGFSASGYVERMIEAEIFREEEAVDPLLRPMAELERRLERAQVSENTIPLETDASVKEYLNACAKKFSTR